MKKIFSITMCILLLSCLVACNSSQKVVTQASTLEDKVTQASATERDVNQEKNVQNGSGQESNSAEVDNQDADTPSNEAAQNDLNIWPEEASQMSLPQLNKGTITSANVVPTTMSDYKRNLIIEIVDVTQEDFDAYREAIVSQGFIVNVEYPGGQLINYVKKENEIDVDLTLGFDPESNTVSIIALDKLSDIKSEGYAAPDKISVDGLPSEVVPIDRGELIDTSEIDMGDGTIIYTLTYKNFTEEDLIAYEQALVDAGFIENDGSYQLLDASGTSMVMVGVEYDGEFMTLTAGKAIMPKN